MCFILRFRNAGVTGSSPVSGTTLFMCVQHGNAWDTRERAFAFGPCWVGVIGRWAYAVELAELL